MLKIFYTLILSSSLFSVYAEEAMQSLLPSTEITEAWVVRKKILSQKDPLVDSQIETVRALQKKYGITSLPSVSNSLLLEIFKESDGNDIREKKIIYAREFSPNSSLVDHFLCRAEKSALALKACLSAYKKDFTTSEGSLRIFANLSIVFISAILIALIAVQTLLFLNHWPSSTLLVSLKTNSLPRWFILATQLTSLVIAYALGGIVATIGVSTFYIGRYYSTYDKAFISLVLFVSMLAAPFFFKQMAYKNHYDLSLIHLFESPYEDYDFENKADKLTIYLSSHPDDAFALFTLGRLQAKLGHTEKAIQLFEKASTLQPKWHTPWIHVALTHEAKGDKPAVMDALKKAIAINPKSVYAHFNLGRMLIQETRLEEAQEEINKAKEADRDLFETLDEESKTIPQNKLMEENLNSREISLLIYPNHLKSFQDNVQAYLANTYKVSSLGLFYLIHLAVITLIWVLGKLLPLPANFTQLLDQKNRPQEQQFDILNPLSAKNTLSQFDLASSLWAKFKDGWISVIIPGGHFYFNGKPILAMTILLLFSSFLSLVLNQAVLLEHFQAVSLSGLSIFSYLSLTFIGVCYLSLVYQAVAGNHGA